MSLDYLLLFSFWNVRISFHHFNHVVRMSRYLWVVLIIRTWFLLVNSDDSAPFHSLIISTASNRPTSVLFEYNHASSLSIRTTNWVRMNRWWIICINFLTLLFLHYLFLLAILLLFSLLHGQTTHLLNLTWININNLNNLFLFVFIPINLFKSIDIWSSLLLLYSKLWIRSHLRLFNPTSLFQLLPFLLHFQEPNPLSLSFLSLLHLFPLSPLSNQHPSIPIINLFLLVSKYYSWQISTNWCSSPAVSCSLIINSWRHQRFRRRILLIPFFLYLMRMNLPHLNLSIWRRHFFWVIVCSVTAWVRLRTVALASDVSFHSGYEVQRSI